MVRPPGKAGAAGVRFPLGLGERGVHELAEAAYGDMPALTGFALAAAKPRKGAILWVTQAAFAAAHGQVLPHGAVGYPAGRAPLLIVRPRKLVEALWTIEEGLRSSAVGLVIADVEGADFTATRRLALASGRHGTPLVLLMPHDREGATAASSRWRRCFSARSSAVVSSCNSRWFSSVGRGIGLRSRLLETTCHCSPSTETSIRYSATNVNLRCSGVVSLRALEKTTRSTSVGSASSIVRSLPVARNRAPVLPSMAC